jgi:hypothetical protein
LSAIVAARHFSFQAKPPVSRHGSSAIAAALLAAASVLAMAALQAQPRDRTRVAVIFAPWTSAGQAIARVAQAGGRIVRPGLIDAIVVVQGDDADLADRLHAAGAWAVVDPAAWGGCLAGQQPPAS